MERRLWAVSGTLTRARGIYVRTWELREVHWFNGAFHVSRKGGVCGMCLNQAARRLADRHSQCPALGTNKRRKGDADANACLPPQWIFSQARPPACQPHAGPRDGPHIEQTQENPRHSQAGASPWASHADTGISTGLARSPGLVQTHDLFQNHSRSTAVFRFGILLLLLLLAKGNHGGAFLGL